MTEQTARKPASATPLRNVAFDVERVRADFPILAKPMRGKPLVFLDSAASAQKPQVVLDAMTKLYSEDYANVHRAVYELSERATASYEGARAKIARYINAKDTREVIFVRGTTEGINLVTSTWGRSRRITATRRPTASSSGALAKLSDRALASVPGVPESR